MMNFNLDLMVPYRQEVEQAILRAVGSRQYILGPEVAAFEEEWAAWLGARYCIGAGNGTDAIRLALMAVGVGPGDEVISPAFNCGYAALAVHSLGATNVFCDSAGSGNPLVTEAEVLRCLTPKTKCVVPVHMYGQMCDMRTLRAAIPKHVRIIEDAAQAHGASDGSWRMPGAFSDAAAWSFYPTKNLGAIGDGGAVTTNDPLIAERVRLLRRSGQGDRYVHKLPGINSCLDEIQAAVLRVKLPYLRDRVAQRGDIVRVYRTAIGEEVPLARGVHANHIFAVCSDNEGREALMARAAECGIPTLIHYPIPVPYQPCFLDTQLGRGPWPHAENLARRVFSVPLHADMTGEEVGRVATFLASC